MFHVNAVKDKDYLHDKNRCKERDENCTYCQKEQTIRKEITKYIIKKKNEDDENYLR